jgi:hypothetical protein
MAEWASAHGPTVYPFFWRVAGRKKSAKSREATKVKVYSKKRGPKNKKQSLNNQTKIKNKQKHEALEIKKRGPKRHPCNQIKLRPRKLQGGRKI